MTTPAPVHVPLPHATLSRPLPRLGFATLLLALSACGGGTRHATLSGTVSGLKADGLVLSDGTATVSVGSGDTSFSFGAVLTSGQTYAVTVHTQPTGQLCVVADGSGTATASDVSDVTITCSNAATILHSFGSSSGDGTDPVGGLTLGSDGRLYGATSTGGSDGDGTLFVYDPQDQQTQTLYSFGSQTGDGNNPYNSLILGQDGGLYGMTGYGGGSGAYAEGTIFEFDPATSTETVLYRFGTQAGDGADPRGGLIQDSQGNLLGTTSYGGASGAGVLFSYNPTSQTLTNLHAFAANTTDGGMPYGSLMLASDGNYYGTTAFRGAYGGANGDGTVFMYNPNTQTETLVHSFAGGSDGASPYGSLVAASDGLLYGLTSAGGANNAGTIFSYDPSTQTEAVAYAFSGGSDAADPQGSLVLASDGNFYGVSRTGGTAGQGTVFVYSPSSQTEKVLYSFGSITGDGAQPVGSLLQGSDGTLYGVTSTGGANGSGTVFEIKPN